MSFFPEYLVKVSVCLALVFLFYHLVLRKLTFYTWNRFYLAGYSLFSFVVPFLDVSRMLEKNSLSGAVVVDWIPVWKPGTDVNVITDGKNSMDLTGWITLVIGTGMVILLLRLSVQLVAFIRMKRRAIRIPADGMELYQVNDDIMPFSFGNAIFINRSRHNEAELEEIIRHEWVHVKQKHSIDILFSELLCLVNWFNPFAWMIRHAIRQNLEYIADRSVLDGGVNPKAYQYLLLKVTGNNQYSIATQFNFSSLKKRIAMMNKLKSNKVNLLRFLFMLPLLAVVLVSFRKQFRKDQHSRNNGMQIENRADTVPLVTSPNQKGFLINIIDVDGKSTVLVRDKNHKEITRVLLDDWKQRSEHFSELYGNIPPPPPPLALTMVDAPVPPPVPVPARLPENVQSVHVSKPGSKVTVTLKNGTVEDYDLSIPAEKKALEKKYGPIVPPPPPAPVVGSSYLNQVSSDYEVTDKKAVVRLKNGTVENYDLTNAKEKAKFETKYGRTTNATTVAPLHPSVVTGVNLSGTVAVDHTPASVTLSVTPSVTLQEVRTIASTPAPGLEAVSTVSSTSATPVPGMTGNHGYIINGKEDIVITITANTTEDQLKKFQSQMKEKGVELNFEKIGYDKSGKLVHLKGTMRSGGSESRFNNDNFGTLVLAMMKKGADVYFKINRTSSPEL